MLILVMGLSGSGKTTLAKQLCESLNAERLNGDILRNKYDDWDFSKEGRIRQAERMRELAEQSDSAYVVIDFICPLEEGRQIINADYTIWMNTIKSSKYSDTDKVFEKPNKVNIISDFSYNADKIIKRL